MNYFDWISEKQFRPKPEDRIEVVEGDWKICPEDTLTEFIRLNLPQEGPR